MKKLILAMFIGGLMFSSCKKDEVDPEENISEVVRNENFFNIDDESYVPDTDSWIQAGIFGYDQAFLNDTIDDRFTYNSITIHISSQFDYREEGKTYTLTTVTEREDVPENSVFISYTDSNGFNDSEDFIAKAGQTIEMTNTGNGSFGINSYFVISDIELDDDRTLNLEAPVNQ